MLSIDISSANVRVMEFAKSGRGIKVKRQFTVNAPPQSMVKGAIADLPALTEALTAALKNNKIRGERAILTVNQSAALFKELVVPASPEKQLRQLLQMEVEQSMGMADDYLMDYILLEQLTQDQNAYKLMIVLMQKAIAADCKKLLSACGLKPAGLTVAPIAIFSAVNNDPAFGEDAIILALVSEEEASFLLIEKNKSLFHKSVSLGQKKAPETDEFILSSISDVNEQVSGRRIIGAVGENISKFCQYQATRNKANPVKRAYICGLDQADMLEQISLNSPVEVLPMAGFTFADALDGPKSQAYAVAAGAASTVL